MYPMVQNSEQRVVFREGEKRIERRKRNRERKKEMWYEWVKKKRGEEKIRMESSECATWESN